MDFKRPVSSIIPGSTGRILETLVRTSAEFNLTTLARVAGVSPAQASRVLPRLVKLGLVTRVDVPPSSLFALNREHLTAASLEALANAPAMLVDKLRDLAVSIAPSPVSITLFGSAARGSASASSDIDVLIERSASVDEDDISWSDTVVDWTLSAHASTGNRVNVIEVADRELPALLRRGSSFWRTVADQGVHVMGRPISEVVRK